MSKYIPKIMGEKVYLSPMFIDDMEQYTRWMNDFEVTRYLGQASKCISQESEKKILENLVSDGHNYAVVLKEEDRLIGNASVFDIQQIHQRAEIGLFIGEAKNRVFSGNIAAINAYKKCGFREIGRRTGCYFVESKWPDEIFMEILRCNMAD